MITIKDIKRWIKNAPKNATHMIVVCDTFDYSDYPVYVNEFEDVHNIVEKYDNLNMQKVMEVYNLKKDIREQLMQEKSFNY